MHYASQPTTTLLGCPLNYTPLYGELDKPME